MTEGTADDWQAISAHFLDHGTRLTDRVFDHLRLLSDDHGGFAVSRLEHSLQTATRAARANRDDEYVACALLHDIGDTLCSYNHPDAAVAILRPFVSAENLWMVEKHGIFQGYHYFHFIGLNRDAREAYRDHECYERTVEFCAEFDQNSFDPAYPSLPLEEFRPLLQRLFTRPQHSYLQEAVQRDPAAASR
ncbi:MAG: HD domain-containing protein [Candidatus Dormibacteraeota bacterium]|uniref:HD domain-containing protein n=1 Tax=Candidatus Amunia macphersoniae TaxID=3127014 RepID=A0A934NGM1_9BACT|nr:HD domain-containing protein [Candidatus Dormibacteraeota bacterium]